MRKITQQAKTAFENSKNFKKSNTQVIVDEEGTRLYLFGNEIARKVRNRLYFTMCGWDTPTTRERLEAVGVIIYQHKHTQYFGKVKVNPYNWYCIKDDKLVNQDGYLYIDQYGENE